MTCFNKTHMRNIRQVRTEVRIDLQENSLRGTGTPEEVLKEDPMRAEIGSTTTRTDIDQQENTGIEITEVRDKEGKIEAALKAPRFVSSEMKSMIQNHLEDEF